MIEKNLVQYISGKSRVAKKIKKTWILKDTAKHIITKDYTIRQVLTQLDKLAIDALLFLVDEDQKLIGSLTDGDVRRGLISGLNLEDEIIQFVKTDPKFLKKNQFDLSLIQEWRNKGYKIIPVLNEDHEIVDIVNFRLQKSYLPIDAVIMAGGKGTRLLPLTLDTPKPLLKIGEKPIVEYNVDRLKEFGLRNITFAINYLSEQIVDYFGSGSSKNLNITYLNENKPLGTIGAISLKESFYNDYILVMNSDLLTNINYEQMFKELLQKEAEMIVATIPYEVNIPYGVVETEGDAIIKLREKPTYTYYSNAGIYIFKKEHVNLIPKDKHFDATDLMEALYTTGHKVVHYSILDYWLDIGKPHDFEKAQKDIKYIKF